MLEDHHYSHDMPEEHEYYVEYEPKENDASLFRVRVLRGTHTVYQDKFFIPEQDARIMASRALAFLQELNKDNNGQ